MYWTRIPIEDKQAPMVVLPPNHWESVPAHLNMLAPFRSEQNLVQPFGSAFRIGHNAAICGASDLHAEIGNIADLDEESIGNADQIFVYDHKPMGIIELKTWWKVDEAQIQDVKTGKCLNI
jgi:hypothetical protein